MSRGVLILALVPALAAGTARPAAAGPETEPVRVEGGRFTVAGVPFYHVGTDCYYLMTTAADPALRPRVDEVLRDAASAGLRTVRAWAFNDGTGDNALQTAPGVYDERVFSGLDYVVQECDSLGLRLVLPLVNNWVDYGGMDQYVAWSPTASTHDDFYTDPSCRQWYRDFAAAVLARYAGNPAILAWELANEPRCASDPSGDTLQGWIEEMSTYLKSLDPDHLVSTGSEGFFAGTSGSWWLDGSEGVDYLRNHAPAAVDFAVAHSWPDAWGLSDTQALELLARQADGAVQLLEKPFVLEEFGKPRDGVSVRVPAHYDPRTYFAPGVRPHPVPGAGPVMVDPRRRATVYADPAPPAANPQAAARASTGVRDSFFRDAVGLTFARGGDAACFWALYDDAYPDADGYGVYLPGDASTLATLRDLVGLAEYLNAGGGPLPRVPRVWLGYPSPNPFREDLAVLLSATVAGALDRVAVTVHDPSGRLVRRLWQGHPAVGDSRLTWDGLTGWGAPAASGVYFIRLAGPGFAAERRVVRLR